MFGRSLARVGLLLALVLTAAIAAPTADALVLQPTANQRVHADYYGYARFDPNYCAPGAICTQVYRETGQVWRQRADGSWATMQLSTNSVLYVYGWSYPYRNTTGWHWAWSYSQAAWLAIPSTQVKYYS